MAETKSFWKKELLSNAVIVNGAPVPWEPLSGNSGLLVLDAEKDAQLIEGLEALRAKGKGGVVKISEEQYEAEKKSRPYSASSLRGSKEKLRSLPSDTVRQPKPVAVAEPAATPPMPNNPAPIPAPPGLPPKPEGKEPFRPATRRATEKPAAPETTPPPKIDLPPIGTGP